MNKVITLDKNYSTTRRVIKAAPQDVADQLTQINKPEDKFETVLFLPQGNGRKGEGGLRTKGYFKKSYKEKPLISIVTVVYNGEQYLEETIQSVIHQTYDNVEYIIIDGGSTDGTVNIIKKYENVIDYWVSENDRGISDAFNKGYSLSIGCIVAILNADDYYFDSNVILKVVSVIDENTMQVIYGKTKKITKKGVMLDKRDNTISWCMSVPFSHCSSFISILALKRVGLYSTKYKIAMDIDLLFRVKRISILSRLNEYIGVQRDGGVSDIQRSLGYKEYLRAAYPECGLKAYLYYFLKLVITLKTKMKK